MATQAILLPTQREKGMFHAKDIPRYTFNVENLQRKKKVFQCFQKEQKFGYPKKLLGITVLSMF